MKTCWNCRHLAAGYGSARYGAALYGVVGFSLIFLVASLHGAELPFSPKWPDKSWDQRTEEPTLAALRAVQNSIRNVVDRNLPAVISISDGAGFGSGVIVSSDGLILTAGHVVNAGNSQFEIFFPNGKTETARLLGYNLDIDAAMLKLEGKGPWPFVELGQPATLRKGDWVVCLGHSGGYELGRKPPVRTGRVLDFREEMIITDAVLIGGDSGGPLFDVEGKLIGIHSSIGEVIAENRHVTIDLYRRDWDRMAGGDRWGQLPDLPGDIDKQLPPDGTQPEQRAKLGVKLESAAAAAVVSEVTPGSPAERVGLKRGDVIEIFGGVKINSGNQLIDLVRQRRVGESVRLQVRRGQSLFQLEVILDQF